jgi:hypothetical protein
MADLLLLSDHYQHFAPSKAGLPEDTQAVSPSHQAVPDAEAIGAFQTVVVLSTLYSESHSRQLAGALSVALDEHAITIVLAYSGKLSQADTIVLTELAFSPNTAHSSTAQVESVSRAFARYLQLYGHSQIAFNLPEDDGMPLALLDGGTAAFTLSRGRGVVYVVPYQVADFAKSHDPLVRELLHAVENHRSGVGEAVPAFLSNLRLPREDEALDELRKLDERRRELVARKDHLAHFRHLVGRFSGDAFEDLVIEALNIVLNGSAYRAEDRDDVGREDFWIVGPDGDHTLAEAKGIGSHVRRQYVSKV